jgi:integrase
MLGHAVEWGLIPANPAIGLRRPRAAQRAEEAMRVIDAGQVRQLLDAASEGQERTLLMTAVTTGARRGELLGLTWGDVDRERGRLWIRRSIGRGGTVQHPKSRRSIRAIAMPASLSAALRDHRMSSRFKASTDYVFSSREGTALDGRNVSRMFTATLKRAGLPTIRFHDLRHTFASLLIHQGAHTKFVSEQLGHASSQITLDRYGHLLDQSYSDESEKLEAALFGDANLVPIAEGAKRA